MEEDSVPADKYGGRFEGKVEKKRKKGRRKEGIQERERGGKSRKKRI